MRRERRPRRGVNKGVRSALRRKVWEAARKCCRACGKAITLREMDCDHIRSVVGGGRDDIGNLQCLCVNCHKFKHGSWLYAPPRNAVGYRVVALAPVGTGESAFISPTYKTKEEAKRVAKTVDRKKFDRPHVQGVFSPCGCRLWSGRIIPSQRVIKFFNLDWRRFRRTKTGLLRLFCQRHSPTREPVCRWE